MDFQLDEEQRALRNLALDLAERRFRHRAAEIDRTEEYPYDNAEALVQANLMGMTLPSRYGGQNRTLLDAVLCVEQVARVCATTARIIVEGNTGTALAISHYGSEAQKQKYIPMIVAGEKPCICITEPEAGSAATDMKTSATQVADGYILNGNKCWITGAGIANVYLVLARFGGGGGTVGIGGIIVDKGTPGFTVGRRTPMMGIRGLPEAELIFQDCLVPQSNLLVLEHGFKKLMQAYNSQRVGAATVALGIAQGAMEEAVKYSIERHQFGQPISDFQGLRWMLSDMSIQVEAGRWLLYRAAANAGHGLPDMDEAAIAKTFIGEMAITVTNNALQVFGGYGYSRDLPLERMVRDARMFTIGGGTSQMMRNVIGRGIVARGDGHKTDAQTTPARG
ncbi:MAG: acyl-CoA dehydrogenase family protein [Dehalococcoidia bacterium]|nr:acyl-CoA dehydrogenase family protein [Dehalococcoidia bacterium]